MEPLLASDERAVSVIIYSRKRHPGRSPQRQDEYHPDPRAAQRPRIVDRRRPSRRSIAVVTPRDRQLRHPADARKRHEGHRPDPHGRLVYDHIPKALVEEREADHAEEDAEDAYGGEGGADLRGLRAQMECERDRSTPCSGESGVTYTAFKASEADWRVRPEDEDGLEGDGDAREEAAREHDEFNVRVLQDGHGRHHGRRTCLLLIAQIHRFPLLRGRRSG